MRTLCALTIVLFAFGPVAGCGGSTSQDPTGTAGGGSATTATSGAGGATTATVGTGGVTTSGAGGSGGGAPRAAGSLSFYLTTATTPATARCVPGSHWVNIPFSRTPQTTTAATRGDVAVDGAGGMAVSCSVKEAGGRFDVTGTLKSPAVDASGKPVNPTVVSIQTNIGSGQAGAQGSIAVINDKTGSAFSSETCSFSVQSQPPNLLGIAPGRVWASVTCPTFRDPASPDVDAVCQIATGFFTLENCDQ